MNRIIELVKGNTDFYIGVGAGAAVLVVLWLFVKSVRFCRSRCKSLVIEEDGGNLELSLNAIRGFLNSVLEQFKSVEVLKAMIIQRFGSKRLILKVRVKPGCDISEIRNDMRSFVMKEFSSKLDILNLFKGVDIKINQLPSSTVLAESKAAAEKTETVDETLVAVSDADAVPVDGEDADRPLFQ